MVILDDLWLLEYNDKTEAFEIIIMVLLKIQVFTDVPHYQLVNSYRNFKDHAIIFLNWLNVTW
jgi:hypothetical protein